MKKDRKISLGKIKFRIIVILAVAVMVAATIGVLGVNYIYTIGQIESDTRITTSSEIKRYHDAEKALEKYNQLSQICSKSTLEYVATYLDKYGVSVDSLEKISAEIMANLYYARVDKEKKTVGIMSASGTSALKLTNDEVISLVDSHYLEKKGDDGVLRYYRSQKVGNGYLIIYYGLLDLYDIGYSVTRPYSARKDELLLWADEKGAVISCSDESFDGRNISDIFSTALPVREFGAVKSVSQGWGAAVTRTVGSRILVAYLPMSSVIVQGLRGSIVPIILMWVIFITILLYIFKIKKEDNVDVDKFVVSHITALSIFGLILTGLTLFYVSALINYSDKNISSLENLKELSSSYDVAQENKTKADYSIVYDYSRLVTNIAWEYMANPDSLSDESLCKTVDGVSIFYAIYATDANATVVASSQNNVGYVFANDDSEINTACWQVLNGEKEYQVISFPGEVASGIHVIVTRRYDKKGVFIFYLDIDLLDEFLANLDIGEVMLTTDMGNATCYAIKQDSPDMIYEARPNASEISYLDSTLDEKVMENGYTGIQRIQGVKYYLNTLHNATHNVVLISAYPVRKISYYDAIVSFLVIAIGLVIAVFILLLGLWNPMRKNNADENKVFERLKNVEDILNERFKKDIANIFVINGVLLVLLLILDYVISDKPLLNFLLGSQWNKGLNLFSVTMILLGCAGCSLAGFFLNKIILLIFNNMGSRGMTIGNLLCSLLRFVFLVAAIIWSLKELGCNLSALLAGAGLAGAAISFCASNTINDLLSGFFIVFEGSFKIGDWIRVGDWRGQVVSIGMRTTKIVKGDCVKILNNSTLTNVTLLDRTNSGAIVTLDVAYGEDLQKVIGILTDSAKQFRDEIPEIKDGPYVKGVAELGASGVTLEMYALADQQYVGKVERDMRLIAKRILDENGVEIPFPQVVVHQSED